MAIPELPALSGVELNEWLVGTGPQNFVESVEAWSAPREHDWRPGDGQVVSFTRAAVAGTLERVWPWCSGYRDYVARETAAGGVLEPIPEHVSPVTDLYDALVAAAAARGAKKEPGGRPRLAAALERVKALQPAADDWYEKTRVRVGQELAGVAAATEPVGEPLPIVRKVVPSWR